MPLNEVGDFLAGVFGPLAIFWLILGFIQQGKELQQSTQALELQAKELKDSVEQQRDLVGITRQQFSAEVEAAKHRRNTEFIQAQPQLVSLGIGSQGKHNRGLTYNSSIQNTGALVRHVRVTSEPELALLQPREFPSWGNNIDFRIEWEYGGTPPHENVQLTFSFIDALGNVGTQNLNLAWEAELNRPKFEP
ncbi:MAG: hypothetical protein DHS20C12_12920 [Pseudohongiella sp.]|nr:MAG: hypothetical protein DHS20C12_12920 [Pseudohongiella sp.]